MTKQVKSPDVIFEQAKKAHFAGELDSACIKYLELLDLYPNNGESHYNLATLYVQKRQWLLAVRHYQHALECYPNESKILYNLSIAFLNSEQFGAAIYHLEKLLAIDSENSSAHHLLACLLYKTNHQEKAEQHFQYALKSNPSDPEQIYFNYAVMLMEMGYLLDAKAAFKLCLSIDNNFPAASYNLGVICQQLGQLTEAVIFLKQALNDPEQAFASRYHLILALKKQGKNQEALQYCDEALTIKIDDNLLFIRELLSNQAEVTELPRSFVANLFEQYSINYDRNLVFDLKYNVPKAIENFLISGKQKKYDSILDLGCGSGLCGVVLSPFTNKLVGIDLAKNMLAFAEKKQVYDELTQEECCKYLKSTKERFDVVVAADLLPYIGDLKELFSLVDMVLKPRGAFIFSFESNCNDSFKLSKNIRFVHNEGYIVQLAKLNNFIVTYAQDIILREEESLPVSGKLMALYKGN